MVESGRGIDLPHWSVSSRVVFARVLGLWVLLRLETGLFVSRGLFVSFFCPPGTSARFWNVPGAGAFGGFDSPAGLRLRLLLLLARDVQSAVPSLRSSVVYAP